MVVVASNPFSTRFTQPGRIEPRDDTGRLVDVAALLDRLSVLGGTAVILGPHGSGKSTLLSHLAAAIERQGGKIWRIRLHTWRDVPSVWQAIWRAGPGDTVCIDSWECTGPLAGGLLRLMARGAGRCLLVTAHHESGFPVLLQCRTSATLLRSIVAGLPDCEVWLGRLVLEADIDRAFTRHSGNLRESLYELYDRFEAAAALRRGVWSDGPADRDGPADDRRKIHESGDGFSYAGAPERNLG